MHTSNISLCQFSLVLCAITYIGSQTVGAKAKTQKLFRIEHLSEKKNIKNSQSILQIFILKSTTTIIVTAMLICY